MDRGSYSGGWGGDFGDQYDPTEYNMGAAASARMHTVLDSSGTRLFVFFCFKKKKRKKKFASISSYRQQQPQGQQLLVIQKKKKKKVFKKLKHNSNDRIKVQTVSGCTAFLSGYSLHQETGEIAVRCNTETSPPDASGVAGQELAQGCPLLVSFGTAGNKQFVDPLM